MSAPLWADIKQIFSQATRLDNHAQRKAYVESACAENSALRREIESLLDHHNRGGALLRAPSSVSDRMLLHYKILERIGEGGMGVAYKALDTRLNRLVVVKVLPPWMAASPSAKVRLQREAQCACALNHPNIVTVHDLACDNGIDFIVMEYVDGKTLDQYLATGRMDVRQALQYATQILEALITAHKGGIVHGDLKPANIVITADGRAKLLDFGLSQVVDQQPVPPGTKRDGHGTPGYMAPEQAEGALDQRSDLYSFGAVLSEMLTGERLRSSGRIDAPPRLPKNVPPALRATLAKCLATDPGKRPQSARELAGQLKKCVVRFDQAAAPTRRKPAAKRRPQTAARNKARRRLLIGAALVCIVAIGAFISMGLPERYSPSAAAPSENRASVGLVATAMAGTAAENAYDRAILQMKLHNFDQAKALLDEVLRAEPGNRQALYNRAVCRQNLHRFQEAVSDYSQVLHEDPKNANALYNRAMCYINLDHLKPALADLTASIRIHPTANAYMNRAKIRIQLGDAAGATDDERRSEQIAKAH